MRPVPPIYHPQIVTDAILYAAENPVRELVAGGAGLGVVYAERVSPRAADFFSETIGFIGQDGGEKDTPEQYRDNLFAPVSGYDTVEGNFSDEQFMSDPYTSLVTSPRTKNSLLLGAAGIVSGFLAWKYLEKEKIKEMKTDELLNQAKQKRTKVRSVTPRKFLRIGERGNEVYSSLKTKLLNIGEWNDHSLMSSYALFDENGRQIDEETF